MVTLEEIDNTLVQSDTIHSLLPLNFVAIGVQVHEGEGIHAGIIIAYNNVYKLLHLQIGGHEFQEVPNGKWYFNAPLKVIKPEVVSSFLTHCNMVAENCEADLAFHYDGSFYLGDGTWSGNETKEYMTCVGFCIAVIRGFLEGEMYIKYTDWDESTAPPNYFETFKKQNILKIKDPEKYRKNIRRITPAELTAATFLHEDDKYPITKAAIDEIIENVEKVLKGKVPPTK